MTEQTEVSNHPVARTISTDSLASLPGPWFCGGHDVYLARLLVEPLDARQLPNASSGRLATRQTVPSRARHAFPEAGSLVVIEAAGLVPRLVIIADLISPSPVRNSEANASSLLLVSFVDTLEGVKDQLTKALQEVHWPLKAADCWW
jgi:hypothetical protein